MKLDWITRFLESVPFSFSSFDFLVQEFQVFIELDKIRVLGLVDPDVK